MTILNKQRQYQPNVPKGISDIDIEMLSEFDIETLLQIITCLMQNKKLIFASNKAENAHMTMLAVRDLLFTKCGF